MTLYTKGTQILFFCPVDSSPQVLSYIIFNPNIVLAGCSKCNNQFKMDTSTWTLSKATTADNTAIKNCNTTGTKVIV